MKTTKNYHTTYNEKHSGYFIFDADYWYNTLIDSERKLSDAEKVMLTEFLLKSSMSHYAESNPQELIYSIKEHHYDSNFEEPTVITDSSFELVTSRSNLTKLGYLDKFNKVFTMDVNSERTAANPQGLHMQHNYINFIPLDRSIKPNNLVSRYLPNLIGKVLVKRKWQVDRYSVLYKIMSDITNDYTLEKAAIIFFML